MIEAKDISLVYPGGTTGLFRTDITINEGELVYITGPSGSGKTSFLKLILGLEYPTTGYIKVFGVDVGKDTVKDIRRNIGPVLQEFYLIKGRTVMENVLLGMRFMDIPNKKMKENAFEALARVGLSHKSHQDVEKLSFGECQRAAIARAVARKPKLILADEPTGNLDRDNAVNILSLLSSFKDDNTTVIITTHAENLIDNSRADVRVHIDSGFLTYRRKA